MNPLSPEHNWNERPTAPASVLGQTEVMFRTLFDRSADAIWLFDPQTGVFVDCNAAAVELMRAGTKARLLQSRPENVSPAIQPDGTPSGEKAAQVAALAEKHGGYRFEWLARRFDGEEVPLEVLSTPISINGRSIHVVVSRDISERKRDEAEIRRLNQSLEKRIADRTAELSASEARFRALVEHAPEAIALFDGSTGRFLFGNEHALRLYGMTAEQLTCATPADVSPEFQPCGRHSSELAKEKMEEALAGRMPVFEWIHRHSNGRQIPTEVRLLRLPSKDQNVIRASIIETSERKRREEIQQAATQISEAVHTAQDLGSFYRTIHYVISGLMPAENFYIALLDLPTQMISFAYHVDHRSSHPPPQPFNTGLTSLVLRTGQALLVGRDMDSRKVKVGAEITFEGLGGASYVESGVPAAIWLGVPLFVQNKPIGVVAVQDYENERAYGEEEKRILTFVAGQIALAIERKKAEAELRASEARLRESEARFSTAFRASPISITISRLDDGKYVLVNEAFLTWSGYSREEVLGRTSAELRLWENPLDRQPFWEELRRVGSIRERECRLRNRSGTLCTRLVSCDLIEIEEVSHLLTIAIDITQRKQAEAELLKTLAREKELGQLKSNFVSMVSHEFRTPLGIIQSSAEILHDYFGQLSPQEREDQLTSIVQNTRRMAQMMEETLVLSRLEAGRMDFKPELIDFDAFCRRVANDVRAATNGSSPIEVEFNALPHKVRADEGLLSHVFTNLLDNAVKYSKPGIPVNFTVHREGDDVICIVRDGGIGIPEPDQPWLFDAFHRGGNVGDRPGTGLGLVLVKRCVELHRGEVAIQSQVDKGTTVTVRLPVYQ